MLQLKLPRTECRSIDYPRKNVLTPSEYSLSVTNINLTDKSLQDINLNISTQLDIKTLAEHLGYHYETLEELKQAVGDMSYFNEQAENVGIFTKDKYQTLSIKKRRINKP